MRCVLVNEAKLKAPASCAHCGNQVGASYVREINTRIVYAGLSYPDAERIDAALMTMRYDHCRGKFGLIVHRYWGMRFCCAACAQAYQQRLRGGTKAKIRRLNGGCRDGWQLRARLAG